MWLERASERYTDERLSVSLGLVVSLCVVDGYAQLSGQFFSKSVVENVLHFRLRSTHAPRTLLLGFQQVHHQLINLHFFLVPFVRVRLHTHTHTHSSLSLSHDGATSSVRTYVGYVTVFIKTYVYRPTRGTCMLFYRTAHVKHTIRCTKQLKTHAGQHCCIEM